MDKSTLDKMLELAPEVATYLTRGLDMITRLLGGNREDVHAARAEAEAANLATDAKRGEVYAERDRLRAETDAAIAAAERRLAALPGVPSPAIKDDAVEAGASRFDVGGEPITELPRPAPTTVPSGGSPRREK